MEFIRKHEEWVESFARSGIVAKGVVYCLIGILTFMAAVGLPGQKLDKADAFRLIYEQPFGKFLLAIIAAGLIGYAMWRSFQAFWDIDHKGKEIRGLFIRLGYAFSALVYLSLAVYALKLLFTGENSGASSQQFYVSKLLKIPGGHWLLGVIALIIVGNGCRQIYKGVSQQFMNNVVLIRNDFATKFAKAGIAGYTARGVVLIIIGYFLTRAALHRNAFEAEGTKGVFDFLENEFGSFLMGIVALGLVAYGVFMFVKSKYQKINLDV